MLIKSDILCLKRELGGYEAPTSKDNLIQSC